MRILKIFVVIVIVYISLVFPKMASASENTDFGNTATLSKFINIFLPETASAKEKTVDQEQPEIAVKEEPKTEEEIKNEAILAKWKQKQEARWKNLPKGQFVINASAYTASADECGNDKGITASGIKVQEKRTIACPPEFPFGVKISIEGLGVYTCEDRGGAIKGNHIDIYVLTKKEAFSFGRQNLMAEIVEG
ncbi:MAG TPA: 3D domain-containing protein [Candidatus Moranbacteria bacterium]|nr:3D domain-containing protein [Candidatus Moranbacteria bacterium]HRY27597.1 3D domain-containing protein [Candidatus Moranbacteria bacterium]HSA07826.1 3D domain-containing protein [Candidatus Moranbacteria bacterium]